MAAPTGFAGNCWPLTTGLRAAAQCACRMTARGDVQLPAFMPVGTQATVKGCTIDMVRADRRAR